MPNTLPGGEIAQGSIFSIYGTLLGPLSGVQVSSFPLQTDLATVTIQVQQGKTKVQAIPLYVQANQINAIMPSNAPLGMVNIFVTFPGTGGTSFFPAMVKVVPSSFGIFTQNLSGTGPAVAYNYNSAATQPLNTPLTPATPGQVLTIYGTGLGPINAPDNMAPPTGNLPGVQAKIFVGGIPLTPQYFGRTSCCAGVDQLNVQLPANVPLGCFVPVLVQMNGSVSSNSTTISISSDGSPCSDPLNPGEKFPPGRSAANFGLVSVSHTSLDIFAATGQTTVVTDNISGFFMRNNPQFFNASFFLPPLGTCIAFTFPRGCGLAAGLSNPIDAGAALSATGPNGVVALPLVSPGDYSNTPGGCPAPPPPAPFLTPGAYTITGPGGAGVGPFTATINFPQGLNWTNEQSIGSITRSKGMNLTWSGADETTQFVIIEGISGTSGDPKTNVGGQFVCSAPAQIGGFAAGDFTVPPEILANLPPDSALPGSPPTGFLFVGVGSLGGTTTFTANGLDAGYATFTSLTGRNVIFQ